MLEPNPTYWDASRTPKVRIVYENAISKQEALESVAAGDGRVDVVTDLDSAEAHAFQGGDKAAIQAQPAKTVLAGVFNEHAADSPWRHVEVRRALNMAIDRDAVVERGVHGYGSVIPAFIQPGRYGAVPGMEAYRLDIAAAAAIIDKAGLKGRRILLHAAPDWRGVVEVLTENMARIGLTVQADYSKTEPEGWDIKLVWHFDWSPQFPVGVVHREFFGNNGAFRAKPADPQFDALYAKLLRTPHQPAQEGVVREVEQYIHDHACALFLISPHTLFAVSNRVNFVAYDTCMSELAETTIR